MKKNELWDLWENNPETIFSTTHPAFPYVRIDKVETRKNKTSNRKGQKFIVHAIRVHDGDWVQEHTEDPQAFIPAQFKAVYAEDAFEFRSKQQDAAQ